MHLMEWVKKKMDDKQFRELMGKLDLLIKLTALNVAKDMKVKEQVRLLYSLGVKPSEIARILGKTQNYVNVTLHKIRKEESKQVKEKTASGDVSA